LVGAQRIGAAQDLIFDYVVDSPRRRTRVSNPQDPFEAYAKAWANMMAGYGNPAMWWPLGGDPQSGDPAVMDRLLDTHTAFVDSGYRHASRCAELSGRAYPLALRAMRLSGLGKEGGSEELGKVMGELREIYREMAELPLKESGRLQARLAEIWQLEESGGNDDDAPKPRKRRARIKS
jgi:hypothetical protein